MTWQSVLIFYIGTSLISFVYNIIIQFLNKERTVANWNYVTDKNRKIKKDVENDMETLKKAFPGKDKEIEEIKACLIHAATKTPLPLDGWIRTFLTSWVPIFNIYYTYLCVMLASADIDDPRLKMYKDKVDYYK